MGVFETIKTFLDKFFGVPIAFLDLAKEKLTTTGRVTRQGLDFSSYMSIFRDLPSSWQLVLSSLLLVMVLLVSLILFRAVMRMYYSVKSGIKWW